MTSKEEFWLPIRGHSCCNKNFQILLTSGLHQLADDANESHDYIHVYLLFRQVIQKALSIISTVFLCKSKKVQAKASIVTKYRKTRSTFNQFESESKFLSTI